MPQFQYYQTAVGLRCRVARLNIQPKNTFERDNNPVKRAYEITDEESRMTLNDLRQKYPYDDAGVQQGRSRSPIVSAGVGDTNDPGATKD